jgi:hypothetical protein
MSRRKAAFRVLHGEECLRTLRVGFERRSDTESADEVARRCPDRGERRRAESRGRILPGFLFGEQNITPRFLFANRTHPPVSAENDLSLFDGIAC